MPNCLLAALELTESTCTCLSHHLRLHHEPLLCTSSLYRSCYLVPPHPISYHLVPPRTTSNYPVPCLFACMDAPVCRISCGCVCERERASGCVRACRCVLLLKIGHTRLVGTRVSLAHVSCWHTCLVGTRVLLAHLSSWHTCLVGTRVMLSHVSCWHTCHVGRYLAWLENDLKTNYELRQVCDVAHALSDLTFHT
jgi:hypothetical protein